MTPQGPESTLPGRILVVDDEAAVADVFRDFLTLMGGHEVETRPSGQAAIDAFATFKPDVVLTDLNLDQSMSGLDLMRRLNRERGLTFLVVTHDIAVGRATDRIVRMVDGEIVEEQYLEVV